MDDKPLVWIQQIVLESVIKFLREEFDNDGAEGESVWKLCALAEELLGDFAKAQEELDARQELITVWTKKCKELKAKFTEAQEYAKKQDKYISECFERRQVLEEDLVNAQEEKEGQVKVMNVASEIVKNKFDKLKDDLAEAQEKIVMLENKNKRPGGWS